MIYTPADVLIHVREPFNKNTLWVVPNKDSIEIRIYDNGWKTICSSNDKSIIIEELNKIAKDADISLSEKLKKHLGQINSNTTLLIDKLKELELKVQELESKIDRLVKKIANLR